MMYTHPRQVAKESPTKVAVVLTDGGGELTFGELERESNRAAHLFRKIGVEPQDRVAFLLKNELPVFSFFGGAQRSGALAVPVSTQLTPEEISYIVRDSGSKLLLCSDQTAPDVLETLSQTLSGVQLFKLGNGEGSWSNWDEALAVQPDTPIADEISGSVMFYSSGTTGRPKGIIPKIGLGQPVEQATTVSMLMAGFFGINSDARYLCPAPLYHAAPLAWTMSALALGASIILMPRFEPEAALKAIQEFRASHGQFVPTHFVRMLKLPAELRDRYDTSSLKMAVHAAAPCPVPIKHQMIDWWGPIIFEYYAGSEGNGMTMATPQEWLDHPGTVGKPIWGTLHICSDDGEELPVGEVGNVFFESDNRFSYHNDEEQTQHAYNERGWSTMGDIGRVDQDGFLYLTDRKSFTVISGGVNIYPQEIENRLITHPKVGDVAVIGEPHDELGEQLIAVVQPADGIEGDGGLAAELDAFCREALAGMKVPKRFDFDPQLPRTETGKLLKRLVRERYWPAASR